MIEAMQYLPQSQKHPAQQVCCLQSSWNYSQGNAAASTQQQQRRMGVVISGAKCSV